MITINLQTATTATGKKRASKKITDLQQQLLLGGLILALVLAGMWYFWNRQKIIIAGLQREKTAAEAKLQQQENTLKEVKSVEEERKKVAEKISIIEQLKKNQSGPVRVLDEISKALPLGVNLTSLSESSNNINLEGEAFTNNDIVRFVDNLKASRFLTNVMLLETSQAKVEGTDIYKYKLQFVYKGL